MEGQAKTAARWLSCFGSAKFDKMSERFRTPSEKERRKNLHENTNSQSNNVDWFRMNKCKETKQISFRILKYRVFRKCFEGNSLHKGNDTL